MTRWQWGIVVYVPYLLVWLLALELPAALGLTPWPTVSGEVRYGITWWHPFGVLLLAILFCLALHFKFGFSAVPLILVSAGTTAGLLWHYRVLGRAILGP